jgi:hypothetical protein
MVAAGTRYFPDSWWISVFPALAIVLIVLGFNLLGDGLRDLSGEACEPVRTARPLASLTPGISRSTPES